MKFIIFTTILGLIFSFGDMPWQAKNSAWAEQIAFVSSHWDSGEFIQEIWTIHSDGTDRRMLTNSPDLLKGWPTWSPDGVEIVFATHEGIGTLHLMDADGGNLTVLKKDYTSSTRPAWSPRWRKNSVRRHFVHHDFRYPHRKNRGSSSTNTPSFW